MWFVFVVLSISVVEVAVFVSSVCLSKNGLDTCMIYMSYIKCFGKENISSTLSSLSWQKCQAIFNNVTSWL